MRSATTTVRVDEDCVVWLECWSDGNPAAHYLWIDWTNGRRTAGRVYRVERGSDDEVIGESTGLTLQCHANNVIARRSYVAASSNVSINLTTAAAAPCSLRTCNCTTSRNQKLLYLVARTEYSKTIRGLARGREYPSQALY